MHQSINQFIPARKSIYKPTRDPCIYDRAAQQQESYSMLFRTAHD